MESMTLSFEEVGRSCQSIIDCKSPVEALVSFNV